MNSADRQSLQFTMNKIKLFKIFGAMSKDTQKSVSILAWNTIIYRGDWCSEGQIVEDVLCNRQLLMPSDWRHAKQRFYFVLASFLCLFYVYLLIIVYENIYSPHNIPLWHRITRKLLKIDRYMLRGVWRALNYLSTHAKFCVIFAGASPGETKMWAAVRENGDFLHLQFELLGNCCR